MKAVFRSSGFVVLCAAVQAASAAHFYDHATATSTTVRLSDVADLSDLPESIRANAADLVLDQLSAHETQQHLSKSMLLSSARSQMPILGRLIEISGNANTEMTIDRSKFAKPTTATAPQIGLGNEQAHCAELAHSVAEGKAIRATDVLWKTCKPNTGGIHTGLRYDTRAHVVRALADLPIGEQFRRLPSSVLAEFREGQTIPVVSTINHVSVQRNVTAVQDGTPGRKAFVKAPDGSLLTAYLPPLRKE